MRFARLRKLTDVAAVQRSHDSNPRHHRRPAAAAQHQRFDRGLPFRQLGFLLRKCGDVIGSVSQRDELAIGQYDRLVKLAPPT
jgi:hypothetical protein